uniref:Large ribosomal subunit protein uL23c n=1 Tax=Antithamnion hubbsii TaxID=1005974 RepID=A0A4D6WSE2_9FLOR|nr:ribosomal protein L23 [Antithamnion hubbsii]
MTNLKNNIRELLDIIYYPIITDKTTQYLEENKYCFAVSYKASKLKIKQAIEYIFNVKIIKINTLNKPPKKRRVGRFTGITRKYKKAVIELNSKDTINLFENT